MKIGDQIIITDAGYQYTTFERMSKILKAKYWQSGFSCGNGRTGVIKNIYETYYLVEFKNQVEIIIGQRGLRLIKQKSHLPEKLFEI